jgi:hypothetical protein
MKKELWFLFEVARMEEKLQDMVDSLMRFRGQMDEGERELFDLLMVYANEVALSIDAAAARF